MNNNKGRKTITELNVFLKWLKKEHPQYILQFWEREVIVHVLNGIIDSEGRYKGYSDRYNKADDFSGCFIYKKYREYQKND